MQSHHPFKEYKGELLQKALGNFGSHRNIAGVCIISISSQEDFQCWHSSGTFGYGQYRGGKCKRLWEGHVE